MRAPVAASSRGAQAICVRRLSRRKVIYAAGTAAGTAAAATLTASNIPVATAHRPQPRLAPPPFVHGVASGDPISNSVVLWTRITTHDPQVTVVWQVSHSRDFQHVAAQDTATTDSSRDYTIHVDPSNLQPATVYFYRFIVTTGHYAGQHSPIGRTKTAPTPDTSLGQLTLAVASCSN